jgi:four helix bundle protein
MASSTLARHIMRATDLAGPYVAQSEAPIRSFRDLRVWQRAVDLAAECHAIANGLRRGQAAAMSEQLRRASISVPLNIAEGNGRRTRPDYLRHLSIATGSLREVETLLVLLERLEVADVRRLAAAKSASDDVGRMLAGLITRLSSEPAPG